MNRLPIGGGFDTVWQQRQARFRRSSGLVEGIIKIVITIIVLTVVVGACGGGCVSEFGGTDGQHTGYITAVENADNLIFDATIVYVKSNLASTQEDKYCVNDPEVRRSLEQAEAGGQRVTVHYHNDFILWKWECNGASTVIVGVEPASPEQGRHS